MSVISEINSYMPNALDKTTPEYEAIFGKTDFTPLSPIDESSDYQCGGIANEMEYLAGFLEYITRTSVIDNFYGEYLERVLYFFTGMVREIGETDDQLRIKFKALCIRNLNPSWITKWMIIDVFSYFFDPDIIYLIENYVVDNLITDGGFELDPSTNWSKSESGASTVSYVTAEMFEGLQCAEISVDSSGNAVSLYQTVSAITSGSYTLDFFTKDDRALPTDDLFKIRIQRSGDSYYYNFDTFLWQVGDTSKTISKNSGTRYEYQQVFVEVPVGMSGQDITITFTNIGGTTTPYKYYIDKVGLGTVIPYPTIKLLLVNIGSTLSFTSMWEGTTDPVALLDYTLGSYFNQDYIIGLGGLYSLEYYLELLNIIKPCGVKAIIEIVERAST